MNAKPNPWNRSFSTDWPETMPAEEPQLLHLHRITPAEESPASWWDALAAVAFVVGVVGSVYRPWEWF